VTSFAHPAPEPAPEPAPAPILGLLLDIDGPIASPVTRSLRIPTIATDLADLANAGIPVIFNTGRSDVFIREQVIPPLLAAGLDNRVRVYAVCEKGASWFTITRDGADDLVVDESLAMPHDHMVAMEKLIGLKYSDYMFYDRTKRAMVSAEQRIDTDHLEYVAVQPAFDAEVIADLRSRGFGVIRRDERYPDANGQVQYRCDPTIISTDIESVILGKDFGAQRALTLLGSRTLPLAWRTVGDSRSDYAMADWLHAQGYSVAHVDVRPLDGIPRKPYDVLTAGNLIHDEAGAAFLHRWSQIVRGVAVDDIEVGLIAAV
jgi:hypothetical protein